MKSILRMRGEYTSSPFVARMFQGILEIRNLSELGNSDPGNVKINSRDFDLHFDPLLHALDSLMSSARTINSLIAEYHQELRDGEIIFMRNNSITINKTIDSQLNRQFGQLLDNGVIACKDRIQQLLREIYDLDIGFLYQNDNKFNNGISRLRIENYDILADYLEQVRTMWLNDFIQLRNKREHEGWRLSRVEYPLIEENGGVVKLPTVMKLSVQEYSRLTTNRICLFVENLIAYGFQASNRTPVYLIEIPSNERDTSNPLRFKTGARGLSTEEPWYLTFEDRMEFI